MARGSYSNEYSAVTTAIDTGWIDLAGTRAKATILMVLEFTSTGAEDFVVQFANAYDGTTATETYEAETITLAGAGTEWAGYINTARYMRVTAADATTTHSITLAGA